METRPLGDTGHDSTVMTFGAIALNWLEQEGANQLVEHVLDYGVNHFDVAPTYGDAELKLGPKLRQHREEIFLGCKTQERTSDGRVAQARPIAEPARRRHDRPVSGARARVRRGAGRDHGRRRALAAFREAKEQGLIDHMGLTSHGDPGLILDALDRIDDLESVMFPLNPVVAGKDDDEYDYEAVLARADEKNVGTLGIKAFAGGSWPRPTSFPEADRPFANWYRPVTAPDEIRERFDFAAAQDSPASSTPAIRSSSP